MGYGAMEAWGGVRVNRLNYQPAPAKELGDTPKQIGGQQEEEEYRGEIESRPNRSFPTSEKEKEIFDNYVSLHSIRSTNFSNFNLIV